MKIKRKINPIHYFKWEFLRRNKSYQRDYDNFKKAQIAGKPIPWDPKKKYNIFPADYRNPYPGLVKKGVVEEAVVFHSQFKPSEILRVDAWSKQSLSESKHRLPYNMEGIHFNSMKGEDVPKLKIMKTLRLAIDIRSPKDHLIGQFENMVGFYKNLVKDLPLSDTRKRFKEYDRYLKVYDLFEKGWGWKRLACRFYPADVKRGRLSYAKKKVKRDYVRCQKMIRGKYGQIA